MKTQFRVQFQHALREYLARQGSATEGFPVVWLQTLKRIPIDEAVQAEVYWELLQWARSYESFTTGPLRDLLPSSDGTFGTVRGP